MIIRLAAIIFFITFIFISQLSLAQKESVVEKSRNTFRIWEGTDQVMKVSKLAAYCAPIFWFSADEPELDNKKGKDIDIPTYFPFESKTDSPVVYYQISSILKKSSSTKKCFIKDFENPDSSVINLSEVSGINIDYTHFYNFEAGLGSHKYDTEQSQFQFFVRHYDHPGKPRTYAIFFIRVTAKAHALNWYDNIYEIDLDNPDYALALPFTILVEEGKHASCSDMNGDGYYTPGYDVNVRTNDAWGVRDVIRSGTLFSANFASYMAKVRRPEYRVFPPLPVDSKRRKDLTVNGVYARDNAVYALRPMPSPSKAKNGLLKHDMGPYYTDYAPYISQDSKNDDLVDWFIDENFIHSFAVSYRLDDGISGAAICFPLLIVKNVEAPLIGGWLVNRMYLGGNEFGYTMLYTPSASRFLDPYLSAGVEVDEYTVNSMQEYQTQFVFETGIKIRGNVTYSPLKFLSFLSPFWGVRLGIKNEGFMTIDKFNYVLEVGAGVW